MIEKIKRWIIYIFGLLIGILLSVLGIKNKKLKKTEEQLDLKTRENEAYKNVKKTEQKLNLVTKTEEKKTEDKISEIKKEEVMTLSEINESNVTQNYNHLIEDWNNGK